MNRNYSNDYHLRHISGKGENKFSVYVVVNSPFTISLNLKQN